MSHKSSENAPTGIRVDRWLWFARFFKSRSMATKLVQSGKLRVNSAVMSKASTMVKPDDVLTFPQAKEIRVVRILAIGTRRGPASEASTLYEDLAPITAKSQTVDPLAAMAPKRDAGTGRPTKADRRAINKLRLGDTDPL